jgi:hypothetical protein
MQDILVVGGAGRERKSDARPYTSGWWRECCNGMRYDSAVSQGGLLVLGAELALGWYGVVVVMVMVTVMGMVMASSGGGFAGCRELLHMSGLDPFLGLNYTGASGGPLR